MPPCYITKECSICDIYILHMPRLVVYYIGSRKRGGCIRHESGSDHRKTRRGTAEILPAAVRQYHLSTAVQYCRQLCRREVHRQQSAGGSRQRLRDHADLYRVRLRMQHRLFRPCLPAVRRPPAPRHEDRRPYHADRKRRAVRGADAGRISLYGQPAPAHSDAGGDTGGLQAVPEHLHPGTALCLLL